MVDDAKQLARSLITIHGADALAVAEHAAHNVLHLKTEAEVKEWARVIDAIKAIQNSAP
jgi:hypothetical protein